MLTQTNINFLFTMLLILGELFSFGQKDKIDSLEREFLTVTSKDKKGEILEALFDEVQPIDLEKGLHIALEYKELNRQYTHEAPRDYLQALNLTGIAYMDLNQTDSALFYFQQLLEIAAAQKDSLYIAKACNNLGALNANLGSFRTAINYMNRSAGIDEATGDIDGAMVSYVNIGSIYVLLGATDSARFVLLKGLDAAKRSNNWELTSTCLLNLGVFEYRAGNNDQATTYFLNALEIAHQIQDADLIARAYHNLATVCKANGDYAKSLEYDLLSLQAAESSRSLSNIVLAEIGLAVSYEKLGQYKEALTHYKQHTILRDSLDDLENESVFIEMQEKYRSEQALKENEILTQKNEIQNLEIARNAEELQNSKIIIFSSIIGLVLLVVLAVTLYNRNVLKQRANQKLQDAYAIIQEKNEDILASIDYASKIQEALLPTRENYQLFKESFFLLRPKDIVSGDFLWYGDVEGKKIVAAVDCTGHGVPGAFMSMIGNTFLHQIVNERGILNPAQILTELRRNVIRALNQKGDGVNRKDGMDMAICVLDEGAGVLEFAGANNPLFLVCRGEMQEIKGDKQPVGYFEGKEMPFTNHVISISKGDCMYLFSDGYADQFGGPKGKKFKYKQLKELLFTHFEKPMQTQKSILIQAFEDWKGPLEQVDDVCVIGVRL